MRVSLNILGSMVIDVAGNQLDASFLGVAGNVLDHFRIVKGGQPPDQDLDGVADEMDNCLLESNPGQLDTDQDGFGNLCDADFDDDGIVGTPDFGILRHAFASEPGDPRWNPEVDMNGDGVAGTPDSGLFRAAFGGEPGPSGLACAGAPPCPAP
jgi:hypothetical protein